MDAQDRLWFAEYRGNKIGMFDTKEESFKEWKLPTPWTGPYYPTVDRNGDIWTGGMTTDRVTRLDPKTGEAVEYFLPKDTNIRRVFVDNTTTPVDVLDRQQPRRLDRQGRTAGLRIPQPSPASGRVAERSEVGWGSRALSLWQDPTLPSPKTGRGFATLFLPRERLAISSRHDR